MPDEVDFPEEMSELDILAVRAASESEVGGLFARTDCHDAKDGSLLLGVLSLPSFRSLSFKVLPRPFTPDD